MNRDSSVTALTCLADARRLRVLGLCVLCPGLSADEVAGQTGEDGEELGRLLAHLRLLGVLRVTTEKAERPRRYGATEAGRELMRACNRLDRGEAVEKGPAPCESK